MLFPVLRRSLTPWLCLCAFVLGACTASPQTGENSHARPVTPEVDPTTRALWRNLHSIKGEGFLFGHQDSLAYGVQWHGEEGESDVRRTVGDYPALYGWDLGHLENGADKNLDGVPFEDMKRWMREIYARGGVVTVSWHMTHPGTGADSWDTDAGVGSLLPGAEHHDQLRSALDRFAGFVRSLTVTHPDGRRAPMPLIFRPWHEHNGDWFWWGRGATTEAEYRALWQFTHRYLVEEQGLSNLLFAFSPDRSRLDMSQFDSAYLYGYPGDDTIDILGLDNYWDLGHPANDASRAESEREFVASLDKLARLAHRRGKLAAMTEGGQDTLPDEDFFTTRLLDAWRANDWTRRIVYMQLWRNANREREDREHFYVPYPAHPTAEDFRAFHRHPATLFEEDLPPLYR